MACTLVPTYNVGVREQANQQKKEKEKKEMIQKIKMAIYVGLGIVSAWILYMIAQLNEAYQLSGGINCFIPIIIGILVAVFGLVKFVLGRFK